MAQHSIAGTCRARLRPEGWNGRKATPRNGREICRDSEFTSCDRRDRQLHRRKASMIRAWIPSSLRCQSRGVELYSNMLAACTVSTTTNAWWRSSTTSTPRSSCLRGCSRGVFAGTRHSDTPFSRQRQLVRLRSHRAEPDFMPYQNRIKTPSVEPTGVAGLSESRLPKILKTQHTGWN